MDNAPIDRLIAASTKEIYGLDGNNNIMVSKDKGQTWNVDIMDSDSKYVPTDDISYIAIPFKYDNNSDYVLLAGNNATAAAYTDSTAFVWSKTIDKSIEDKENKWTYYNYDSNRRKPATENSCAWTDADHRLNMNKSIVSLKPPTLNFSLLTAIILF